MHTCFSFSNPSDQSCLKCCSNCPINTPYVNCIMPRKQEDKTSNRHNQPLLLPLGLICHWINTDDDTRWQQTGWYHLSSRATKGASVYDMWWATLTVSLTIRQCVQLKGGRASRETACSSRKHCKQQIGSPVWRVKQSSADGGENPSILKKSLPKDTLTKHRDRKSVV